MQKLSMLSKTPWFGIFLIVILIGITLSLPLLPIRSNRSVSIGPFAELEGKQALVYFGYPGCGSACPTTLATLRQIYQEVNSSQLSVAFVDLMPWATDRPSENDLRLFHQESVEYVHNFHPDFKALLLTPSQMEEAKTVFGLDFSNPDEEGVIFHRGYTYLMEKEKQQWTIKMVYRNGTPNVNDMVEQINLLPL